MLKKKRTLCSKCETGKKDFELDRHSIFCSHINCLKNGNCSKYMPLRNTRCK